MSEVPPNGDAPELVVELGDVAELTEGIGKDKAEAKRQPYN